MTKEIFDFKGNGITVIKDENNDPWFVAKEVCMVLGIQNVTQALGTLDDDERSMHYIGRQGKANIVNEPGLYSLIFKSRKPEAKEFKRWVTHTVLPMIRKTGGYIAGEENCESDEELILRAMIVLKNKVEEMTPKAEAFDSYMDSSQVHNFREAAKLLGVGPNKLTRSLREFGVFYVDGTLPKQRYVDAGVFTLKTYKNNRNGHEGAQTLVTPEGVEKIRNWIKTGKLVVR